MFNKKIITGLLVIAATSTSLVPCYGKNTDTDEVSIKANNCSSVAIKKSDNNKLKFDYDKNYFKISTDKSEKNKLTINIEQTKNDFKKRATIYLPDKEYSNVYAQLDASGMSFEDIDYPLNVDAKTLSAVSFEITEDFSTNINLSGEKGAYSVKFSSSLPENFKFVLNSTSCPISLPDEWNYKPFSPYFEYSQGDGSALINLNIKDSPLSVTID